MQNIDALVIAQFRVQYDQYSPSFSYFANVLNTVNSPQFELARGMEKSSMELWRLYGVMERFEL